MDLTEAEDIKKRWQEYTEELYKKVFMTQIIMMVHETEALMEAGFSSVEVLKNWGATYTIKAVKLYTSPSCIDFSAVFSGTGSPGYTSQLKTS